MELRTITWTILSSFTPLAAALQCYSGLYMIVARGSLEQPGEGTIGAVASIVSDQIPNSYSVGVNYPAVLRPYRSSEGNGTAAMTAMVEQYVKNCPQGKIALMGYSQGAQVLGDVLCGTTTLGWPSTPPLSEKYAENIVAAIQMGDPTFIPHLPYDVGTSVRHGKFPRQDIKTCLPYANRIKSYCNTGDPFCALGKTISVHFGYTTEYSGQAAAFVVKNYKNPPRLNPFPPKSTAGQPSPTSTQPSSTGTGSPSGDGGSPSGGGNGPSGGGNSPSGGGNSPSGGGDSPSGAPTSTSVSAQWRWLIGVLSIWAVI